MSQKNSKNSDTGLIEPGPAGKHIFNFRKTYPAYIVLVIFISISFLAGNFIEKKTSDELRSTYDKATISIMNRLDLKLQTKTEILESMTGLYYMLVEVVKDYFELYASVPAGSYESIISIDYAPFVKSDELDMFIFNTRAQGGYDVYKVEPRTDSDTLFPIEHLVPYVKNKDRLGFNLYSDGNIRKAIDKARDSNEVTATEIIEIKDGNDGFLILSPIYEIGSPRETVEARRSNFKGVVAVELDAGLFIKNAIGSGKDKSSNAIPGDTAVMYSIYQKTPGGEDVIFQSGNFNEENNSKADFQTSEIFEIADKELVVKFYSMPGFGGDINKNLPEITLAGSLFFSFGLFAFVIATLTGRARAMDLAERMTRSQRRIVETTKDIIASLDFEGNWKTMNPASKALFEKTPEELKGNPIYELFVKQSDKEIFHKLINECGDEETRVTDFLMRSGHIEKWVNWSFTVSKRDGIIYAIGRDVTIERLAEQESKLKAKQIELAELKSHEQSQSKTDFILGMSFRLRNSLTSIMGFLGLIKEKVYSDEQELTDYASSSLESSEQIYSWVANIDEAIAVSDKDSIIDWKTFTLNEVVDKIKLYYGENYQLPELLFEDDAENVRFTGDKKLTVTLLKYVFDLFNRVNNSVIKINATENNIEKVTELVFIGPPDLKVERMIDTYKSMREHIIMSLKYDEEDVLFHLAKIESIINRMSGSVTIEALGSDEGNLMLITLPLFRQTK
jgi:PAS domain S-box-containing protein